MSVARPVALQLCPYTPALEEGLAAMVEVVRWFDLDAGPQESFLGSRGSQVHVVATGGHIGCSNALMDALPNLGLIAINGIGFDKVDLAHAAARSIAVTNTPDVLTADVADLAVGLVIALMRGIVASDRFVRAGQWLSGEMPLARRVSGSRFGIVGLGRIGRATANRLAPFGEVRYFGRGERDAPYTFERDLRALARWSDVLLVTCASNAQTRGLVAGSVLSELGERGILVNVSRGAVVDEPALIQALQNGSLGGAALDVFADEPGVAGALIESDASLLTPHIGSATHECRAAMAETVLANLAAFLADQPLPTPVR